jgi:predicted nuclease of predicted toxin-antitoxin system
VKLFLDAHVSARRVAAPLRDQGHDVRAADEERELDGFTDEELLSLAAGEGRIFVTFDVKDFSVIARRWAEAGRPHAGCAIVVGIDHGEFAVIFEVIVRELAARSRQDDWMDLTIFLARATPS